MTPFKKIILFVFVIIFSFAFNFIFSEDSLAKNNELKQSILLVHPTDSSPKGFNDLLERIATSFKHFSVDLEKISLNKYREGFLDSFDFVFYVGTHNYPLSKDSPFLRDVVKNYKSKSICWIYAGMEDFLSSSEMGKALALKEPKVSYDTLTYRKTDLKGGGRFPYTIDIKGDYEKKVKIHGLFKSEVVTVPFCLNIDNFWYFSILPKDEDDYIVFCDILYSILEPDSQNRKFEKSAFLLVEGITLDSQPEKIRDMYRFFAGLRVTFATEITPVEYKAQIMDTLSDDRFLLKNIFALLSAGGVAVVGIDDLDTGETVDEKINELIASDIIPLAFIDKRKYIPIQKDDYTTNYFSTIIERGDIPFVVYNKEFQRKIFIQNKFPHKKEAQEVSQIYQQANRYSVLRDAVFGVTIPSEFDKEQLLKFIRYLRRLGYRFFDLRTLPNYVRSSSSLVFSNSRYYAAMPYKDKVYANKKKADLIKLKIKDKFLSQQIFTPTLKRISEKISKNTFNGTALIDIPAVEGVFVVKQIDEKPTALEKYKTRVLNIIFGGETASWLDVINRLTIWAILLMTVLLLGYLIYLLISQLRSEGYR